MREEAPPKKKKRRGVLDTIRDENSELLTELLQFVEIDQDNLSDEIADHPGKYILICVKVAQTKAQMLDAKSLVETATASVALDLRKTSDRNTGRVTDATIKAMADSSDEVLEAKATLSEATKQSLLWEGVKDAMHQRSYLLNKLADLYIAEHTTTDTHTLDEAQTAVYGRIRSAVRGGRKNEED